MYNNLLRILFHVAVGVFIGLEDDKLVSVEVDMGANKEIVSCEILRTLDTKRRSSRLLDSATLQKLSTRNSCKQTT